MSVGRHVVVLGGDREVGPAHGAAGQAQAVERLRRRDLVHEVEIDVEEVGLAVGAVHDVAVPDLLAQCARLWHHAGAPTYWDSSLAVWNAV